MENSPVLWARAGDMGASSTVIVNQSLGLPSISLERGIQSLHTA